MPRRIAALAALFGVLAMTPTPAPALQVPTLAKVTREICAPGFTQLSQERKNLTLRLGGLKTKVRRFNQSCASVTKGSSAASRCRSQLGALKKLIGAYSGDARNFNNRTSNAPRARCAPGHDKTEASARQKKLSRRARLEMAKNSESRSRAFKPPCAASAAPCASTPPKEPSGSGPPTRRWRTPGIAASQ